MTKMIQPRAIADLSEVPEDEREWYVAREEGGFELHPVLAEECARHEAELARMKARTERLEAALHDAVVARDIRVALRSAGVDQRWHPAITAYLREHMQLRIEEDGYGLRTVVADAFGEVGVEYAVNTWLATEEADAYRPAPRPTDGPLTARLRVLRNQMQ